MNAQFLNLIRNSFVQDIKLAEQNLIHNLLDENTEPKNRFEKVRESVERYKDVSLTINYWDEFVDKKIMDATHINNPEEGNNENPK